MPRPDSHLFADKKKSRAQVFQNFLRMLGLGLFLVYVVWNLAFLALGRFAPSMLTGATGLPSPTTGGTRSFQLLFRGEIAESLDANPMAVPIAFLFMFSLVWLAVGWLRIGRLRLPDWFLTVWIVVLGVAWILKLTGDRAYW